MTLDDIYYYHNQEKYTRYNMDNVCKMTRQQLAVLLRAMAEDELVDAICRCKGSGVTIRLGNGQSFYISVKEI